MKPIALLGDPVAHSRSPVFQNIGLVTMGVPAHYITRRVTRDELGSVAEEVRTGRLVGANITVPHKRAALELADDVSPTARRAAATNTWASTAAGGLLAANTDIYGWSTAWRTLSGAERPPRNVVIIGAGGAARAACVAFERADSIVLVNRTHSRAQQLAEEASGQGLRCTALQWPSGAPDDAALGDALRQCDLVVQATSIPLAGREAERTAFAAFPLGALSEAGFVLDAVYAPHETLWVEAGRTTGRGGTDGAAMLLHQGMASLALWAGRSLTMEAATLMRGALAASLGRKPETLPLPEQTARPADALG